MKINENVIDELRKELYLKLTTQIKLQITPVVYRKVLNRLKRCF